MEISGFIRHQAPKGADLVLDSRKVSPGDVFCAVTGGSFDGRDYIPDAIGRGASAILWEEQEGQWQDSWQLPNMAVSGLRKKIGALADDYYEQPSKQLEVIAVTGTKGKTTVATWCAQILRFAGMPAGYIGTLGAGMAENEIETSGLTTPDSLEMHRLLSVFRLQGCQAAVLEASSHGLEQDRLAGVECDVAVFTNIGSDHLEHHASKADYIAAKCLLFQRPELKAAAVNSDDEFAQDFADACNVEVLRCGKKNDSQLRWSVAGMDASGTDVTLEYDAKKIAFKVPVIGEFNAGNAALAASAALLAGVSWDELEQGLTNLQPVTGRMQRVDSSAVAAYVDYAHTPEALREALVGLRTVHAKAKLHCVFGCGGERDQGKRAMMGKVADELADNVIITNDNPRGEDPEEIANEILSGMTGPADVILDRGEAIRHAVATAQENDVVLIAGKGHERGITTANGKFTPFSDLDLLTRELEKQC